MINFKLCLVKINFMFTILKQGVVMIIGEKIKSLRLQKNLTQEELANRCELTKGFISQIERDKTSPSIATLVDILESLGTDLQSFFNEKDKEKIIFTQEDVFVQENEDLKHRIEWIVPNAQKNDMEPIIITLDAKGTSVVHKPFEGEVFGYVLSGAIRLHLDESSFEVHKGQCFYHKCNREFYLENTRKTNSKVLWISTPPFF